MRRYVVDHGMEGRVEYAVGGCNTIQDLDRYLSTNPRPQYRLVSSQWLNGNWILVWELKPGLRVSRSEKPRKKSKKSKSKTDEESE